MRNFLRLLRNTAFPLSFKQLLGVSFAVIWLLLGGALFRALAAVDTLSRDSRDFPSLALQQSGQVRELGELTVALERQVRQYGVLHDAPLRQDIHRTLGQSLSLVKKLGYAQIDGLGPDLDRWDRLAEKIINGWVDGRGVSPWATEDQLGELFGELGRLDREMEWAVGEHLSHRSQALEREFERQRQNLIIMGLTATTWAFFLALGLGAWLSWSFAQLDRAIRQLGRPQQIPLKPLGGPSDIRLLGERVRWVQQRLGHLESAKLQFLRHISHELKTPLANVREGVSLLEEQVPGPINQAQRDILAILRANTLALQQQIEGLLEYNAAASGAHHLLYHWTDLPALIQEAIEQQRLLMEAKSLRAAITGQVSLAWVDSEKMTMIISNLLINAVRFSPVGGQITWHLAESSSHWGISVQDQGPGVDEGDVARIFDAFFQGKRQPAGARKGSGVGLSIVRELVQAHGGHIALEESVLGALFYLEIPKVVKDGGEWVTFGEGL